MEKRTCMEIILNTLNTVRKEKVTTINKIARELKTNWNSVKNATKILELMGRVKVRKEENTYIVEYVEPEEQVRKLIEKLEKKNREVRKKLEKLRRIATEEGKELVDDIILDIENIRTLAETIARVSAWNLKR